MPKTFRSFTTNLNWEEILEDLSVPESPYLAIKHTGFKCKRPHVHAYLEEPCHDYAKRYKKWNMELREDDDNRGPFKEAKCDTDFPQYMVKEPDYATKIKARFGYTLEQLNEWHSLSDAHRDNLKQSLRLYMEERLPMWDTPEGLHQKLKLIAVDYYLEKNICIPPNVRWLVLSAMLQLQPTPSVKQYISNIM